MTVKSAAWFLVFIAVAGVCIQQPETSQVKEATPIQQVK
jgi:hypothetical protein